MKNSLSDRMLTLPQYIVPQFLLSWIIFKLTRLPMGIVTHWIIKRFTKHYGIDMSIAQLSNPHDYATFNQFFTRALKPTARPLAKVEIISPVDGEISQIGQIDEGRLIQAKDHSFQLEELLGGQTQITDLFQQGLFCTIYLSPKDYHRVHIPTAGQLTDMVYVPGKLFSVNQRTTRIVPNLFARNERIICLFETEMGFVALVLVGALLVGCMETIWAGTVTPNRLSQVEHWHYIKEIAPIFQQGAEIGRFNMGSTVIILLDANHVAWLPELTTRSKVLMGQGLVQRRI